MAVGAILAALIVAHWYDMRRNLRALRAEIRGLREDFRSDIQDLRQGIRADVSHVHNDLAGLRKDIQTLIVRMARIEGFLLGYFAARGPRDRHDDAA